MSFDFKSFKKSSSIDKLSKALENVNKGSFKKDDRYWQLEVDKAGNGYAEMRFHDAPAVDGESGIPWAQKFSHSFQGPGGWYIENSLTTLGQKDPVSELNSKLWQTGIEANKKIAQARKRKLGYISNITVIKDPVHPENEGKQFLFEYGKKIFDKIQEKVNPSDEQIAAAALEGNTLTKVNVFSFWEGANFKLKARKVDGYRNYDKSEFVAESTPVAKTDAEIEKLWKGLYSLKAEIALDKFKPYADLEAKLAKVLGSVPSTPVAQAPVAQKATAETTSVDDDDVPFEADETPKATKATKSANEDDDMLNFLQKMAE